ncbi:hypothetical protein LTR97_002440 [Elasticomyces elasticus]|uniref:DNA (cytosine-5-)-methyltransferase n=1 Tax=Elasticomyces elasticus TaxID=574655 RepID=A0AAN7WHR3_9PEZI|nr:hypothetical protein LTR97_002440 [Elasticomyces elasticus]
MAPSSSRKRRYSSSNDWTGMDELIRGVPLIDLSETDDEDEEQDPISIHDSADDDEIEVESDAGVLPRGQAAERCRTIAAWPLSGFEFVGSARTSIDLEVVVDIDVELMDGDEPSGDFLRVKRIMSHRRSGEVILRGILFRRAFLMDRMLRKAQNEICAILVDVEPDEANPRMNDHLADVPIECVGVVRRVILTNIPFAGNYGNERRKWDDHSFRDRYTMSPEAANDDGELCCRWKRVEYNDADGRQAAARTGKKAKRDIASQIFKTVEKTTTENEETISADSHGNRVVRRKMRSESVYETQFSPTSMPRNASSRRSEQDISPDLAALISEQRTHFDALAGGGGATSGAQLTGSIITFLLDKSVDACNTLRLAFPGATILQTVLGDFFHNNNGRDCSYQVATAHISYPCKTYSGAHTRAGKDDEMNEDAACSVEDIFRMTRPKVATFEQTNAMVSYKKNHHVWRRLIRDITWNSYSVRWRVMDATKHGSTSKRERLIIIAACPGHPLPAFPPPRVERQRTIRDVLAQVGLMRVEKHMQAFTQFKVAKPRYDDDVTLNYTITCSGGEGDIHPGGERSFTGQELAVLAGFPWWRRFAIASMTKLREIIGNVVPVGLAMDLYYMVHKSLDEGEEEMAQWLLDAGLLGEEDVIAMREKQELRREDAKAEAVRKEGALHRREPKQSSKPKATQAPIVLDEDDVITID